MTKAFKERGRMRKTKGFFGQTNTAEATALLKLKEEKSRSNIVKEPVLLERRFQASLQESKV